MTISLRLASILTTLLLSVAPGATFSPPQQQQRPNAARSRQTFDCVLRRRTKLFSDWNDDSQDNNKWRSVDDSNAAQDDWEAVMAKKADGTFWSEFESSDDHDEEKSKEIVDIASVEEVDESEVWLETLASLQAEEVTFNLKEAERADKARQMQEWGFDAATIASTLDIAVDTLKEDDEVEGMQSYRESSYSEEEDLTLVESHTKVEKDPDTGEPIRTQMVYVDEHTCIGCTK